MGDQLPQVGATIDGRYRIERTLGRGSMGLILAARHVHLGHLVAIKFPLSSRVLSNDVVERLLREARAVMQLQSEHVARVYDIGVHQGTRPYLVMEYLKGSDLAEVLRSGPLRMANAVDHLLDASAALAEAHAKGIVHRDLKPSNLFVAQRPDGVPWLKVIDFGLAKNLRGVDSDAMTHSGAILGTPWFMAPEQMRGQAVDERADIWALGATLYALLTGRPPFAGKNMLDVYDRILAGPPDVAEPALAAGGALEAVVHRCLSVQPAERYASVVEFADALVAAVAFRVAKAERVRRIADSASSGDPTPEQVSGDADPGPTPLPGTATVPPRDPSWQDRTSSRRADTPGPLTTRSSPTKPSLGKNVGRRAMVAFGLATALALGLARFQRFTSAPDLPVQSAASWTTSSAVTLTPPASFVDESLVPAPSVTASAHPVPSAKWAPPLSRALRLRQVSAPASAKPLRSNAVPQDPLAEPD